MVQKKEQRQQLFKIVANSGLIQLLLPLNVEVCAAEGLAVCLRAGLCVFTGRARGVNITATMCLFPKVLLCGSSIN